MKIKRIICGALSCALAMSMLIGCGEKKGGGEDSVLTSTDIALAAIEESKLSEDEMFDAIKKYYDVFNVIFETTGDDIVIEVVKNSDGSIAVNTTRPELDDANATTGKTVTDEGIFSWSSYKEAFAYLYEQKQVDLDGNLMFSQEEILAQMTQAGTDGSAFIKKDAPEATDSASDSTTDSAGSEIPENTDTSSDTNSKVEAG